MKRLLVTGASGGVASQIRPLLRQRFEELVLTSRSEPDDLAGGEVFRASDLADRASLLAAMEGCDGILHLGGVSTDEGWDPILEANIVGLHTLFEAARETGIARIVFASSNHATGFWPRGTTIGTGARVRPDGFYGVSKAFGEAMAALYADKHGLRILSIRIGSIMPKPQDERRMSLWQHPEDFVQQVEIGLTHPDIHNQIVWGISDNDAAFYDRGELTRLGYRPRHRAEEFRGEIAEAEPDLVADAVQGGPFASDGFDGDLARVLETDP